MSPCAMYAISEIISFLEGEKLNGNQLNKSFYSSWSKVESVSERERLADQLTHYFTTYGLEYLGLYDPEFVYLPSRDSETPEAVTFKVIGTVSQEYVTSSCLNMLSSGVALKQETIHDIVDALSRCNYNFSNLKDIRNREASVIIAEITGVLPSDPASLFRYLVYKSTGMSLIIKSLDLIHAIKASCYMLPDLSHPQMVGLSQSFNRYKPLWLAFKSAHKSNARVVNKISKLSKVHHSPLPQNVLGCLTSKVISARDVEQAAKGSNFYQLIRAVNALRYYSASEQDDRYYRIRNGKGFSKKSPARLRKETMSIYHDILVRELKSRASRKVFMPPLVDYSTPVSEKMFSGNIPKNTCISVPWSDSHILVGVFWKDAESERVDLDLSAISLEGDKVGWNSHWRSEKNGLMYSGDVTSGFQGASEWMFCKKLKKDYLIVLNGYRAEKNHPFKIIVGYGEEVDKNYTIHPDKVLFQSDTILSQKQIVIGMIKSCEKGLKFYLIDQSLGENNVSVLGEKERISINSISTQVETSLRLRDIFTVTNTPEEADVDLSFEKLEKDSILKLFS